jgi:hypothetical protein
LFTVYRFKGKWEMGKRKIGENQYGLYVFPPNIYTTCRYKYQENVRKGRQELSGGTRSKADWNVRQGIKFKAISSRKSRAAVFRRISARLF